VINLDAQHTAQDLAIAISSIVNSIHVIQIKSGIYHFCGDKVCSWYEFAQAIFHEAKLQGLKVPQKIEMTTSDIYNSSVNRPKYSVLDCSKILSKF
jgi:dTDP-4-dehydrorhamnose reductase